MFCSAECKHRDYDSYIARERAAARAKLTCQHCGKPIEGARRQDRKYCDLTCQERARYWRRKGKPDLRAKLTCLWCGDLIVGAKRSHRQFCLLRCQWRAADYRRRLSRSRNSIT
jgi:endogenous inhibitor of DNA gyrase (YacG/DUF329 family)